jgi:hypothetical protein
MKKALIGAVVLLTVLGGSASWAQTAQGTSKPQWALDHEKALMPNPHAKKAKPVRKIAGAAKWGANQVSPPPKNKQHP